MDIQNRWSVRDVITTVLLSMLIIAIQFIVNMVTMLNNFVNIVLGVGIGCFLSAPVYFLLISKVKKRFVSFVFMILLGLVFTVMGFWFNLPYFIVAGAICELILWRQDIFRKPKRIAAAWCIYSLLYIGSNFLPLWFFWDAFEKSALEGGMSREYIDTYMMYYSEAKWIILIFICTLACALVGSLIGSRIMNKHFKKAGLL